MRARALPDRLPRDWPLRAASRRILCKPHDWHVQITGEGPDVLLLHGAGASAHSWAGLRPHLPGYRLIAPDLPGQGFTRAGRRRFGLDAMADDLVALCQDQNWRPGAIVGHSAGAAIALRLAEIMPLRPACVIGINAALGPFDGFAGWLFPKLARAMTLSPFMAHLVTRYARQPMRVERVIAATGSTLPAADLIRYRALFTMPAHVEATLGMMADWRLEPLLERLPQIALPVRLIAGAGDVAVPATVSHRASGWLPAGEYVALSGLGHLAHEEAPQTVAPEVLDFLARHFSPLSVNAAVPTCGAGA
ncbi:MAG: alpha/beta fold hydrolase BchO [Pararhodobacter sp.]